MKISNKIRGWVIGGCLATMVATTAIPTATVHAQNDPAPSGQSAVQEMQEVHQVKMTTDYVQPAGVAEAEKVFMDFAAETPARSTVAGQWPQEEWRWQHRMMDETPIGSSSIYAEAAASDNIYYSMLCGAENGDTAALNNVQQVRLSPAPERESVYDVTNHSTRATVICSENAIVAGRQKTLHFFARVLGEKVATYKVTIYFETGEVFQTFSVQQNKSTGWLDFYVQVNSTTQKLYAMWEVSADESNVQVDALRLEFFEARSQLPLVSKQSPPPAPILEASLTGRFDSAGMQSTIARELMLRNEDVQVIRVDHEGRVYWYYVWARNPSVIQYYNEDGSPGDFVQLASGLQRDTFLAAPLSLMQPNISIGDIGNGIKIVGTVYRAGVAIATMVELSTLAAILAPVGIIVFIGYVAYLNPGPMPSAWKPVNTHAGDIVAYRIDWVPASQVEGQQELYVYKAESIPLEDIDAQAALISLISNGYDEGLQRNVGYVLSPTKLNSQYVPLTEDPAPFAHLDLAKIVTALGAWSYSKVTGPDGAEAAAQQMWRQNGTKAFGVATYLAVKEDLPVQYWDSIIFEGIRPGLGTLVITTQPAAGVTVETTVTDLSPIYLVTTWLARNSIAMPRDMPIGPDRDTRNAYIAGLLLLLLEWVKGIDIDIDVPDDAQSTDSNQCIQRVPFILWSRFLLEDEFMASSPEFKAAALAALASGDVTYSNELAHRSSRTWTVAQINVQLPAAVAVDPDWLGGQSGHATRDHFSLTTQCKKFGRQDMWLPVGNILFREEMGEETEYRWCYDHLRAPGEKCGL